MVLDGLMSMKMIQADKPQIVDSKDVLIRMTHVGVCGSDVHYYTTGRIGSQVVEYPFAVGHEGAGIIEAIGDLVTNVKVGDNVAIDPSTPCLVCDQCMQGRHHTCRKNIFLGCPGQAEGCLSDYIVMNENSCVPIPSNMSLEEAALIEPLSIGVYACKLSQPHKDFTIGILGFGPIGMSVMMAYKAIGARAFYVTDKIDARLSAAIQLGAIKTININELDPIEVVKQEEPLLLDVVFECCGQQEAVNQALKILKPGGKLMMVGIPEVDKICFDMDLMRRKELCVQNVRRQNNCVQEAIDLVANGKIQVKNMSTHHFSLEETKKAFDLVHTYQDGVMKAMICFEK